MPRRRIEIAATESKGLATDRTEQPTDSNAKETERNSGDGKQGLIDG